VGLKVIRFRTKFHFRSQWFPWRKTCLGLDSFSRTIRNLSRLSNRLFREQGGRRIPEAVLQRDYCLAWFLATLATHPLREHLAFKGSTALRRCHFANYRFSEDLDFTLLQAMEFPAIQASLE
jgi:uncharacterized protein